MLMESQVKFYSPLNISGASQQIRVEAFCWRTESDGDLFEKQPPKNEMAPYGSSG